MFNKFNIGLDLFDFVLYNVLNNTKVVRKMTLSEYIKNYRSTHGISQRQFAAICDVSNGYISMLEKGINPKTGEPITPTPQSIKAIANGMGMTMQRLLSEVDDLYLDLSVPNLIRLPNLEFVPRLGPIACGTPILAQENIEDMVPLPDGVHADFALRCKGDSMINARIFDGDTVYVRQQPTVENGEIAAVLIGNEATLKRVRLYDDHIILQPENPEYKPYVYWHDEMNEIQILGLAVAFTGAVR